VVKPGDTPQTTELTFPKGGAPSLSIASILVQNPYNDAGVVSLLVHEEGQPDEDATTLVSQALLNQTMPNVSLTPPKTLAPTETLRVSVLCSVPGSIPQPEGDSGKQSTNCQVTVLVGGYVRGGAAPPTPKKLS
jgi:hypothetical protein